MKKEKIKNILLIVIVALVTSFVTAYGVSSTFDSSNVCYQVDSNTAASVQDTIDDLYGRASDYSELNNKVSTLEGYFQYDPSSYFNGDSVSIARNSTNTSSLKQVELFNNGVSRASLYFHPSDDATYLTAKDSSGTWGQGRLYLSGNPVTINGIDIGSVSSGTFSIANSNITACERCYYRKFGRVVVLDFAFTVGSTISGSTDILFSGLPKAFADQRFRLQPKDNSTDLILAVNSSGNIINQWSPGGVKTGIYQGQAVYISSN